MLFKEIPGQDEIKARLKQTVKDHRIGHAQLFVGPEGSGKLALAIAYAQFINCKDRPDLSKVDLMDADSCGKCPSCVKFTQLGHPDLHFIYPVATTKAVPKKPMSRDFFVHWRKALLESGFYLSLGDWHSAIGIDKKQGIINADDCSEILRTLSYKSYESEYKVVIIWAAERLYYSAAPKLLKIIEEPPDKTLFILITDNQEQILKTILSRTQIIKIPALKQETIRKALMDKMGAAEKEASRISRIAEGNLVKAISLLNRQQELDEVFNDFVMWMRMAYGGKIYEINEFINSRTASGREKNKAFLNYCSVMMRNAMLIRNNLDKELKISISEREFLEKFAPFINNNNIEEIALNIDKAQYHIERNANPQFTFMDLSLKLGQLLRSAS